MGRKEKFKIIKMRTAVLIISLMFLGQFYAQNEPMNLSDCLNYGLVNSPQMTLSNNELEMVKYNKRELYEPYLPQLNLSGGIDYNIKLATTIIPASDFGFDELIPPGFTPEGAMDEDLEVKMGQPHTNSATLQLEQTIYDQSVIEGLGGLKTYEKLSNLKSSKITEDLMYNIAMAYYQVLTVNQQIELLKDNREQYEKLEKIMELRLEKGVVQQIDYNRIKVAYNNIISKLSLAKTSKDVAKNRLKVIIGMSTDTDLNIDEDVSLLKDTELPEKAQMNITNRLDYKINETKLELQTLQTRVIKNSYLPTLSGYARYGVNSYSKTFRESWDKFYDFSTVGLKLKIPIFNGFKVNTKYNKHRIELENLKAQTKMQEENFKVESMNSKAQLIEAHSSYKTDLENMQLAQDVYETTNLSYQKGASSLSDFLNADYSYKEAQSNYLTSLINMLSSRLDYEKSRGNLSNYLQNK